MSKAAAIRDFSAIFAPSPAMDAVLLTAAGDIEQLVKGVNQFEAQATAWRAGALAKLANLDIAAADVDAIAPQLTSAIGAVEMGLQALGRPLHTDPVVAGRVNELSALSPSAGKIVRKLLRRIERIRVAQHAVHVDLYYGLLALQSELEGNPAEREHFRDPETLRASLRSHLA